MSYDVENLARLQAICHCLELYGTTLIQITRSRLGDVEHTSYVCTTCGMRVTSSIDYRTGTVHGIST